MKPFSLWCANRRATLGLTQKELADQIGIGRSTVSQWEYMDRGPIPSVLHIPAIARALQVPVTTVLEQFDVHVEQAEWQPLEKSDLTPLTQHFVFVPELVSEKNEDGIAEAFFRRPGKWRNLRDANEIQPTHVLHVPSTKHLKPKQ